MAEITAAIVKELRDRTDMPMMECKAALKETDGDIEKAIEMLRVRGKIKTETRASRDTAEGRIGTAVIDGAAAVVEIRCESPSVTKTEAFVKLANDLAKQVASTNAPSVEALMTQQFVDDPKKSVDDRMHHGPIRRCGQVLPPLRAQKTRPERCSSRVLFAVAGIRTLRKVPGPRCAAG